MRGLARRAGLAGGVLRLAGAAMKYRSTRGEPAARGFSEILLEGLAPDGGLYLPAHYPPLDAATLARWRRLSYADLAFELLSLYIDVIPPEDLRRLVRGVYTEAVFGTPQIVPLRPGDGMGARRVRDRPPATARLWSCACVCRAPANPIAFARAAHD